MIERVKPIERPIFVLGSGRCGSSIFHDILCQHPDLAYLSNLNLRFPNWPWAWTWNVRFMKLGQRLGVVTASEAYPLLNKILPGFGRPTRTLTEADVLQSVRDGFRDHVQRNLRIQKRSRFAYKYTGWSRIRFFNEIFPDALFIHVVRDGRAVAQSMLRVPWWNGWQGPQNWRWGPLPEEYVREWEEADQSFAVLAGIEWKMLLDEADRSSRVLQSERYLTIRYEDLVDSPVETFQRVTQFCGLPFSKAFEKRIRRHTLRDMNYKWKQEFPAREQELLNRSLKGHLERYGYDAEP